MWPLYVHEGSHGDEETKTEEEPHRWLGDARTAYFNDFKAQWSHVHNSSLRELSFVAGQDSMIADGAKERFCAEAAAVWQAVTAGAEVAAHRYALDSNDAVLPSVWHQIQLSKITYDTCGEESDKTHLARPKKRGRVKVDDLRDTVWVLDRQDNWNGRRTVVRLHNQIQTLAEARLREPPALPECPMVWADNLAAREQATEEKIHSANVIKDVRVHPDKDIASKPPRMIDIPYWSKADRSRDATRALVVQADQVIESILVFHTRDSAEVEITRGLPSIFDSMKPLVSVLHRGHQRLTSTIKTNEKDLIKEDTRIEKCVPKRIKFDGLLKQNICQTPISVLASAIFKSVVKKNASILFGGAVPGGVTAAISTLLRRASSAGRLPDQSGFGTSDGIRLQALPCEIVNHDGRRVEDANFILQEQAQHVCRSIQLPQISLTNLSLALPPVWRHKSTVDFFKRLKLRLCAFPDDVQIGGEETGLVSVDEDERTCREVTSSYTEVVPREAERPSKGTDKNLSPVLKIGQENEATESSRVIAPPTRKSVTIKIDDNISTDALVTSFLDVDLSGVPLQEESSTCALSACTKDLDTHSITLGTKLMRSIDQLARPAVWFLGRLKVLKVNSTSKLDGLLWIHLEVLETIASQLHGKLREMRSNPSRLSAEDIIETCSAFRYVVWLHTLRMIVCHADSRKAALHVTWRLLESRQYQLSIGSRQITALSNLYQLMGGSPDTLSLRENNPCSSTRYDEERPIKRSRSGTAQPDDSPIRVVCDMRLLERDELLEAMFDLKISVVERELSPAIDIIIDERNAIVLITQRHFEEEHHMRALTYELASSQVQFEKLWLIIDDVKSENTLHLFYAALANFAVAVQTFICKGEAEASEVVRGIVEACAESALSQHRVLPKMWFGRPFMLEEESQLERFLSSTRIVSGFAAQSILHRLSIEDLTTRSLDDVSSLIGSLPHNQVELLWRLLHTSHGIGTGEPLIA